MSRQIPNLAIHRMVEALIALLCFAALSASAEASTISVRLVDSAGRPVPDAVVTLRPAIGTAPRAPIERGYRVVQRDTQFHPFVTIVPVGATVSFPNLDPFRHHVYSFSPAKHFELKLFARDQSRSVIFDRPGVVAIGCNIHDSMSAFIYVADSAWTEQSAANGLVVFRNVPSQTIVLQVWHPYLRTPGSTLTRQFVAGNADRSEAITLSLRPPPMHAMGGY